MKTLLIQVRNEKGARDHELDCFLKRSGLKEEEVITLDVFARLPVQEDLEEIDALVIGGSGDYLVSQGDIPKEVAAIGDLISKARAKQLPVLGICFGAQIMAHTQGGRMELDESRKELGTFEITKTSSAANCPIFSALPNQFDVQLGHKDHVAELPNGAVRLASSERSAVQAFVFPGEPTYAFTFHPELDVEDIVWRLDYYAENYDLSKETRDAIIAVTKKAPHGTRPLELFFTEIVKNKQIYPIQER